MKMTQHKLIRLNSRQLRRLIVTEASRLREASSSAEVNASSYVSDAMVTWLQEQGDEVVGSAIESMYEETSPDEYDTPMNDTEAQRAATKAADVVMHDPRLKAMVRSMCIQVIIATMTRS
jgi:hypothetical protein